MSTFPLKPTHKPVKAYFEALATFTKHGHTTEGNTRSAFADLLKRCCPPYGWHLVEEYQFKGTNKKPLRADGALVDDLTLFHGLWEAKDADDDLTKEIKRKRDAGYPLTNILFQSPSHAVLYQGDRIAFNGAITTPEKLVEVLELFFEHKQSHEVDWEEAVTKFAEKIPDLARRATEILEGEFKQNATFRDNFRSFAELCRQSINPDLTDDAIRKMLVQHLLTERIFRKVFNNQEFLQRNVIAAEIEKVIRSITARHFYLNDPYVRAFRWASDRIGDQGVIAYISNNSFVDQCAFDGMRKHLYNDFSRIHVIDLGGNVRKHPQLSGTTHNVFGIQVGVCVTFLIKKRGHSGPANLSYTNLPLKMKRTEKQLQLRDWNTVSGAPSSRVVPNKHHSWLNQGTDERWYDFLPLGSKGSYTEREPSQLIYMIGPGVMTNRDRYVFNFNEQELTLTNERAIAKYNVALGRLKASEPDTPLDSVVDNKDKGIKWSRLTKKLLADRERMNFRSDELRPSAYRPFTLMNLYFDENWSDERGKAPMFFPEPDSENILIVLSGVGMSRPFQVLATNKITEYQFAANGQTFGRYYFDTNGVRRDNVTDWALNAFRMRFNTSQIDKDAIFHCIYAMLHAPEYRSRYADFLVCQAPRIPFPPDFHAFAQAGKRLMELHIDYEKQPEYKLEQVEDPKAEVSFRVTRMVLNKKDRSELKYNDFLTLRGVPLGVYDYRLGNRSALEWVVDQYRVTTDPRSGIINDPNREDDPKYILRLIGQVISVSLETNQIVANLPSLHLDRTSA